LAYQDILDDLRFVCANRRAASDHAARGNAVYHYALTQFFPDPQLASLGAFHGIDVPFLFDRNAAPQPPQVNLREKMQATWIAFARSGNPGNNLGYLAAL
jgi:carboxylesterase type B